MILIHYELSQTHVVDSKQKQSFIEDKKKRLERVGEKVEHLHIIDEEQVVLA